MYHEITTHSLRMDDLYYRTFLKEHIGPPVKKTPHELLFFKSLSNTLLYMNYVKLHIYGEKIFRKKKTNLNQTFNDSNVTKKQLDVILSNFEYKMITYYKTVTPGNKLF